MEKKTLREEIIAYGKKKYHSEPEYLWADTPDAAVLRHDDNRKWYALIMQVERARLGLCGEGAVDVLNVKCDPDMVVMLKSTKGFLPAYHMSKTKWISVLLDGTVEKNAVLDFVDRSFALTMPQRGKRGQMRKGSASAEKNAEKCGMASAEKNVGKHWAASVENSCRGDC